MNREFLNRIEYTNVSLNKNIKPQENQKSVIRTTKGDRVLEKFIKFFVFVVLLVLLYFGGKYALESVVSFYWGSEHLDMKEIIQIYKESE